ncbi:MAG: phosphate ABC transporter permease subunit PstC [Solibacterales bacterium]|nr:phosphate ABC transporter permease subunit PstC [Bryobacterales bacterium]|tara:strand:+ start:52045 stop:52974 length:930 start_codon:yes stop_codon:yes gene_type:complete
MTNGSPENTASLLVGKVRFHWKEEVIRIALFLCAILSVATTLSIVVVLATEAFTFFENVSLGEFLLGGRWTPLLVPRSFGVLPLVCGTLLIVAGAALIALPVGLATAVYLGEYAPDRVRSIVKPVLEVLAGIPTVVYGYFALTFVTPLIRSIFPSTQIFNAASASIVVSIMVLPMVASLCDDSLRAVPLSLRQGAYALGATSFEVTTRVVVPASLSGVVASFVLALSRAIGETMAVTLAAGATPRMTINPLESIQTMTAYIVQVSLGDTPAGSVEYQTIFAVAALLFTITLMMNVIAHRVLRRFREVYE